LADPDFPADKADAAADTLRTALRDLGYGEYVAGA